MNRTDQSVIRIKNQRNEGFNKLNCGIKSLKSPTIKLRDTETVVERLN